MNKQAIVLDMDGTLLDPLGNVSENISQFISLLREKGMYIFLATGRTYQEVVDVLPESFEVDGMVCANGMETIIGDKRLASHVLDEEIVQEVVKRAQNEQFYYEIHPLRGSRYALLEDKKYMELELEKEKSPSLLENEYVSRMDALHSHIEWTNELTFQDIVKVYFFSMDKELINAWETELEKIKNEKSFSFSTSSSSLHNIEIMVDGVSKATGIKKLLAHYQMSSNSLLAVGDGENDLPMFKLANVSVAMKNASDFVKENADKITKYSYEEDGLYQFLTEYFNEKP